MRQCTPASRSRPLSATQAHGRARRGPEGSADARSKCCASWPRAELPVRSRRSCSSRRGRPSTTSSTSTPRSAFPAVRLRLAGPSSTRSSTTSSPADGSGPGVPEMGRSTDAAPAARPENVPTPADQCGRTKGTAMILATTTVENVDRFLDVFGTKGADKRALHGSKGSTVFRDPTEENRVWALFEWDENGWAQFVSDPEVPPILKEAGHLGKPEAALLLGSYPA